jgi:hypothetical protein
MGFARLLLTLAQIDPTLLLGDRLGMRIGDGLRPQAEMPLTK